MSTQADRAAARRTTSRSASARRAGTAATPAHERTGAGVETPTRGNAGESPRTGTKRTLTSVMRDFPSYLRLLYGLMMDQRVAAMDKMLVVGAIAYVLMPLDWIPDFIPFLGEVDDVFVLVFSLQRLIKNAGRRVLLDHWIGEPGALEDLNLQRVLAAAAFFLPRRIRRRLRAIGRL